MSLTPSSNYSGASHLGNVKENWLFQLYNQNSYLSLDGSNDYINLGSTSSSSPLSFTSSTKMSACGWVKFPTLGSIEHIFANNSIINWAGVVILKNASNKLAILWGDTSGTGEADYELMITNGTFSADTWTFFAITTDFSLTPSNTKIWLGTGSTLTAQTVSNSGTAGITTPTYTSGNAYIGRYFSTYSEIDIRSLGLWTGELDSDSVTALFNGGDFLSFEEDSGNYDQSSNLKGYFEFNNGENFAQDIAGNVATGTINGGKYKGFLPLSIRDTTVDNVFYHGVVKSEPSIRNSIDVFKSTSKTGNVSVSLINSKYQGSDLSAELFLGNTYYYNRTIKIFSQLNELNDIDDCLQLYHGRLTNISHDDANIRLSIVQKSIWDDKFIPTVKSTRGNYFPVVYGNYTKNESSHGTTNYLEGFGKNVFPVQVDRTSHFYECLLHKDIGSTDTTLHYYESGADAFLPLDNANNAEAYESGYAVKTDWTLKRHIKFKPIFTIQRTFADPTNLFDGTSDQTLSDNSASLSMAALSSGTTTTTHKDNNFSLPSFDDPPDISSSSENHGLTIEMRWNMTGFYGETGNSAGLENNKVEVFNQSRYATGTLGDTMNDGTIFATNGSFDESNDATGSSNSTTIAEVTSSSNGGATATEFSSYPYNKGLSIRVKRTVTSETSGSGTASSSIFGTLNVADIRLIGTFKIDRTNSTTDASARINSVKTLYSGADGLTASWDDSAITLGHQAHRDALIRFSGMPTITPENYTVLAADRTTWTIKHWQNKEISLKKYLEKLQFEFGFCHKIDPSGKSKYIWIHGTAGNNAFQDDDVDVTLTKADISSLSISTTSVSDIATKSVINSNLHPATKNYITKTTSTNPSPRATYNIKSKENTTNINLDALTLAPATSPATDKQADFFSYYSQVNGDVKKLVDCEIVNTQKGYLLETGDIVKFEDMTVNPFARTWDNYYMVTDIVRSVGKIKIKCREVG
tara:strand:+ start:9925 stop:12855 length:2931 start_codon:yes stop_codon:yes gene_type:complete